MSDARVKEWVELALRHEDLTDYTIDVQGKTNKDDGYLGNVTFLTVSGRTRSGSGKTLDLVVKSSKESTKFRGRLPVKEAFEKEIFMYDHVMPAFQELQREKGVAEPTRIAPRCFATRQTGQSELLVLENLKTEGYGLWDRKVPMPFDYIKVVLEAYGKWHAQSFALKKEKPETYRKFTENNINAFSELFVRAQLHDFVLEKFNISKETLGLDPDCEILKKVNFTKSDVQYVFGDLLLEDPEHNVIFHGDSWTNNFLFKFEENTNKPVDVKVIDWQCAGLGSPIVDISSFMYNCCSKESLDKFSEMLEVYYKSLSAELKKLKIDPEEVFSFETLMKHWKKFSVYGIVISPFILRFSLCEPDEAPDLAEAAETGEKFIDSYYFTLKHENVYLERVKHNLMHYLQHV